MQPELAANQPAEASVLSFDESTVTCAVQASVGELRIHLPRAHFAGALAFGMPISIGVEEVEGVRRPIIRMRNVNEREDGESVALQKLIDQMD
jgi:hypothetical protein